MPGYLPAQVGTYFLPTGDSSLQPLTSEPAMDLITLKVTGSLRNALFLEISSKEATHIWCAHTRSLEMSFPTTPMNSGVDHDARILYDYHHMSMPIQQSADAIFTLCSFDLRVAHRAVDLFDRGKPQYLIFSGGYGKHTAKLFTKPEAEVFADIALTRGVPKDRILLERESTNTGENVRFTFEMLKTMGLGSPGRMILVQSPYMERRTYATFRKQWPDPTVQFSVTSPQLSYDEYPCEAVPKDFLVTAMVETLVRIQHYPGKGFQITQDIPDKVQKAGKRLIAAGYNRENEAP